MVGLTLLTSPLATTGLTSRLVHLLPLLAILATLVSLTWKDAIHALKTSLKSTTKPSPITENESVPLKPLAESNTKKKGRSAYVAVVTVAATAIAGAIGYGVRSSELHAAVVDTYYDVYVVSNPDGAYNYWLDAHDATGKDLPRLYLHFCSDFEPEFSAGQTLTILNVEHKWGCVSVAHTHPGYRIKRNENGEAKVR